MEMPDSLNTPPSVAPLMSGLLLIKWSWPSIFWFLSIASSTIFLATLLFLPETCRQVVGNGSRRGPPINRAIVPLLSPKNSVLEDVGSLTTREKRELDGIKAANPFSTLTLLKCRSTALAIACYSIYYTIYSCLQASLSTFFVETYKVTGLIAGLSYIPFGVACVLASSVAGMLAPRPCFMYHLRVNQRYTPPGKMLDFDYRRTAVPLGLRVDRRQAGDLSTFPIERARLRTCKYSILLCAPFIVAYGWVLQTRVVRADGGTSDSLSFMIRSPDLLASRRAAGAAVSYRFYKSGQLYGTFTHGEVFPAGHSQLTVMKQSLNALLVDLHPNHPSAIQALNNFFRCELAAGGLAVLDVMRRSLGPGWCFVVFAALHLATLPVFWVMERHGLTWRRGAVSG
jgi:hypothetical protein